MQETQQQINKSAIVRMSKDYVTVLCYMGHLIEFYKLDNHFGGSYLEVELTDHSRWNRLSCKCEGEGHQ